MNYLLGHYVLYSFEDHLVRLVLTSLVLSSECLTFFCLMGYLHDDVILLLLRLLLLPRCLSVKLSRAIKGFGWFKPRWYFDAVVQMVHLFDF